MNMNYQKHYTDLIETRRERIIALNAYYEKHHIVMRSMGGTDDPNNLVMLTAREHFLAHWLLWRIHQNQETACAFFFMCSYNKTSSRVYNEAREAASRTQKERWASFDKEARFNIVSEQRKKWSPESRSSNAKNASLAYWSSLSTTERADKNSYASRCRWDKLSDEQKSCVISKSVKTSWNVLTQDEKTARAKRIWEKRRLNGNTKQKKNR